MAGEKKKSAWFATDCCIHTNPKVIDLSLELKLDVDATVGKLARLWAWAIQSGNETGDIGNLPDQEIADIMRWKKSAKALCNALVEFHFLDATETGRSIHGWYEMNGKNMEKLRKDRARKP